MANNREDIRIEISAPGADETVRDLHKVSNAEKRVGDEATKSGRQIDDAGQAADRTRGRFGRMSDALGGVVKSWMGVAAVSAAIISFLNEVATAATNAPKRSLILGAACAAWQ